MHDSLAGLSLTEREQSVWKSYQIKKCDRVVNAKTHAPALNQCPYIKDLCDTVCHLIWTQEMENSRQMRSEIEAPKTSLVQVIRGSCFASHFVALELFNLLHFYRTACAEG